MIVSIHQPNYAPWLGYFYKLAQSDLFVFLDDAQYSKGSYTNRVRIRGSAGARWLTQPVSTSLGAPINKVEIASKTWITSHLDTIRTSYRACAQFKEVWPEVRSLYEQLPDADLATVNRSLIENIAVKLELGGKLIYSSEILTGNLRADDRLIAIVSRIAPGGTYLSGSGGKNYQDSEKFQNAGIRLDYANFQHPTYQQTSAEFIPGLSIFDAVFNVGWEQTRELLEPPQ